MSHPPEFPEDRLLDLLADQALDGLSDAEMVELDRLLEDAPQVSPDELAIVAASLAVSFDADPTEPLPSTLRARIEADFDRRLEGPRPIRRRSRFSKFVATSGWIAAAASWLVTTVALWPAGPPPPSRPDRPIDGGESTTFGLKATDHPLAAGASGEMVWSQDAQQGYLKLVGLAAVDPSRGAYQLWIFDDRRDPRYPIDGGAFTIGDGKAPTVVPVRPLLHVGRPSLFAITLEPPGGVVVSDRRRILLAGEVSPDPSGR
ncbi:anti-sigma factor domain-containing protein [Tundrisphaera lichenicola]|uniref:anti-sigma factor domain-containing protein n=1 Tax=Tundrisphaera lichenicola TaxID=2029860 RepID=UPI003EC0DCC4